MERKCKMNKSQIIRVCPDKGESIEEMLRRLTANKEPIPDNVPEIFTAREEGVIPDYDIRADRFEAAYNATNKFAASKIAAGANKGEVEQKQEAQEKQPVE